MRLFVTRDCPKCQSCREILDALKLRYTVVDATTTKGQEEAVALDISEFPVLEVHARLLRTDEEFMQQVVASSFPLRVLLEAEAGQCSLLAVSVVFDSTDAIRRGLSESEWRSQWLERHKQHSPSELDAAVAELREKDLWPWRQPSEGS